MGRCLPLPLVTWIESKGRALTLPFFSSSISVHENSGTGRYVLAPFALRGKTACNIYLLYAYIETDYPETFSEGVFLPSTRATCDRTGGEGKIEGKSHSDPGQKEGEALFRLE